MLGLVPVFEKLIACWDEHPLPITDPLEARAQRFYREALR